MNKQKMLNIYFIILAIIIAGCGSYTQSTESWVDYDSLPNIKVGIGQKEIMSILGEPLIILGDNDDSDNTTFLFYNYHVKRYLPIKDNQSEEKVRDIANERNILLKFTFHDDALVSWEEDNITLGMAKLGMAKGQTSGGIGIIKYLNLLINIVLLIAVFGG